MSAPLKAIKDALYKTAHACMSEVLKDLSPRDPLSREVHVGYAVAVLDSLTRQYGKAATYEMVQGWADHIAAEIVGAKVVKTARDPQP